MERVNVRRLPDEWGRDHEALLQSIDDATATPIYVAYKLAAEWLDGLQTVIDDLEALVRARPDIAIALIEHTMLRLDRASGHVDDSDGGLRGVVERLESLHARAAVASKASRMGLAGRLVELAVLDLEPFADAASTHREALGRAGLEAIICAAEKRRGDAADAVLDHIIGTARAALAASG